MAVMDLGKVVPEKGIDYLTESDINEIVADVKNDIKVSDLDNDAGYITKNVNDLTYYTLATDTGHTIDLSINSSTYVMTLDLKNSAGTVISTDSIDLPLESVVVNGSYDSTNKKIILTLQSGNTIEIPVGDLVSGLQSEITSQSKLSSDLVDDTDKTNKFVTASEKTAWSGKQDALTAGNNITISNNVISATVPTVDLSNYLAKDNTTSYTPSGDYNPATKKYVDDNAGGGPVFLLQLAETDIGDYTQYYTNATSLANASRVITQIFTKGISSPLIILASKNNNPSYVFKANASLATKQSINTFISDVTGTPNDNNAIRWRRVLTISGSWSGDVFTCSAISTDAGYVFNKSNYLSKDNTSSFTPSGNYNPATKKYVDDITGSLTNLTTTDKTNLVSAINEVAQSGGGGGSDLPIFVLEIGKNLTDSGIDITSSTDKASAGALINEIYNSGKNYGVVILRSNANWYEKTYIMTMRDSVATTRAQYEFFTCASANLGGTSVTTFYIWKRLTIAGAWSNGVFTCSRLNWDVSDPLDMSQILFKNNVWSYTPTNDYNPATKKYVDDAIANIPSGGGGSDLPIIVVTGDQISNYVDDGTYMTSCTITSEELHDAIVAPYDDNTGMFDTTSFKVMFHDVNDVVDGYSLSYAETQQDEYIKTMCFTIDGINWGMIDFTADENTNDVYVSTQQIIPLMIDWENPVYVRPEEGGE